MATLCSCGSGNNRTINAREDGILSAAPKCEHICQNENRARPEDTLTYAAERSDDDESNPIIHETSAERQKSKREHTDDEWRLCKRKEDSQTRANQPGA